MAYEPKNNLYNAYDDNMVCVGVDSDGSYLYIPKESIRDNKDGFIDMSKKEIKACNLSDIIPDGTQLAQANMFYCGDWAYVKKIGKKGLVKEAHIGEYEQLVTLLMEDGTMLKVRSNECDFTTPDSKTAFLTELQALMKRYNATIDVDGDECALWLTIDIDGHAIEYVAYDFYTGKEKQTALTPDNIFNYDKEYL